MLASLAMKYLMAIGLSVAMFAGLASERSASLRPGCPSWGCGENGTAMTGLLIETAVVSARPHGCPTWGCGENGTQVSGLLIDASDLH